MQHLEVSDAVGQIYIYVIRRLKVNWIINCPISLMHGVTMKVHKDFNPLNAELNPICHLLALLGGATIVVVSRLRVNRV